MEPAAAPSPVPAPTPVVVVPPAPVVPPPPAPPLRKAKTKEGKGEVDRALGILVKADRFERLTSLCDPVFNGCLSVVTCRSQRTPKDQTHTQGPAQAQAQKGGSAQDQTRRLQQQEEAFFCKGLGASTPLCSEYDLSPRSLSVLPICDTLCLCLSLSLSLSLSVSLSLSCRA